jgi:hypothetical protein
MNKHAICMVIGYYIDRYWVMGKVDVAFNEFDCILYCYLKVN